MLDRLINEIGLDPAEVDHFMACGSCSVYDIEGGPYRCPENPIEKPRVMEMRARRTVMALGRFAGTMPGPDALESIYLMYQRQVAVQLNHELQFLRRV